MLSWPTEEMYKRQAGKKELMKSLQNIKLLTL